MIFSLSVGTNKWDDEPLRKFILSVCLGALPFLAEEIFLGGSALGRIITIPIMIVGYIIGLWISGRRKNK